MSTDITHGFAVRSNMTGKWFHTSSEPEARTLAKRHSTEHPTREYDVIRLHGNLFDEHNETIPEDERVYIPRQEIIATYGPFEPFRMDQYWLVCRRCGNQDQGKFQEALVQGGILCYICQSDHVVKQTLEEK